MRWRRDRRERDPVLIINGSARPISEVRHHAVNVRDRMWRTEVERGLAISLVAALDELNHEGGPVRHETECPNCGHTIRARMADK